MDHVAIMKKSWGLIEKVLTGEKTVESRWYKTKHIPWDIIKAGDTIYFQDSGEPVSIRAKVTKVLQYQNLNPQKTRQILAKYAYGDLGTRHMIPQIKKYVTGKNYCILIFFNNVEKIKPFRINKAGFGAMAAWLTVDDINSIKKDLIK